MSIGISDNFRRLEPEEVSELAAELSASWKDPSIPMRQWIGVVRSEIERYRDGECYPHFDVLMRTLARIPQYRAFTPTLLDVGASSGFYSEILKIGGFECDYTGCDYSAEYERLAHELFPEIQFKVGDARALPFADNSFAIVLSGCCLLHIYEYEKVIAESARVAREYVVMNRTPILLEGDTTFYEKSAYGVKTLEIHFSEYELMTLFTDYGLDLMSRETIFTDKASNYRSVTYLLKKS